MTDCIGFHLTIFGSNAGFFKQFEFVILRIMRKCLHHQNLISRIWKTTFKLFHWKFLWQNKAIICLKYKKLVRRKSSWFGICKLRNSSPPYSTVSESSYFLNGYIIWIATFLKWYNGQEFSWKKSQCQLATMLWHCCP